MLIEQADDLGPEALERGFCDFLDVFWPTVRPGLLARFRIKLESELGRDYFALKRKERGLHLHEVLLLVNGPERPSSSISESDAAFHG